MGASQWASQAPLFPICGRANRSGKRARRLNPNISPSESASSDENAPKGRPRWKHYSPLRTSSRSEAYFSSAAHALGTLVEVCILDCRSPLELQVTLLVAVILA